ncbi:Hypp5790 [Branchiostoma lanceolatum]|uniref:Hypp5790 protein n=1 Tax=Branchiostoma lanceolatum TaxID=7740 RepID=A0A8J9YQZ9_BRALA|nr:Hypp5790 [Branchiostoma lanceolatum]
MSAVMSALSSRRGSRVSTPAGSVTGSMAGVSSDSEARQAEQIHHLMVAARKWRQKYENASLELKAAAKKRKEMEEDFLRKQLKMQEEHKQHEKEVLKAQSDKYEAKLTKLKELISGLKKSLWPTKKLAELNFQIDYERAMRRKDTDNFTKDRQKLEDDLKEESEQKRTLMDRRERRLGQLWRMAAKAATMTEQLCKMAEEEGTQNRSRRKFIEKQTKRYELRWEEERDRAMRLHDAVIGEVGEKVADDAKLETLRQSFESELKDLRSQLQMDNTKLKAEFAWQEMDLVNLYEKAHQENTSVVSDVEEKVGDLKREFCMVFEQIRDIQQTVTYMDEKLYPVHLIVQKLDAEKVRTRADMGKINVAHTARQICVNVSKQRKELAETLDDVEDSLTAGSSPQAHQALLDNLTHLQVLVDLNSRELGELRRILKCRKATQFYDRSKGTSLTQNHTLSPRQSKLSSKGKKSKRVPQGSARLSAASKGSIQTIWVDL